ncbi:MAG: hypothetical protein MUD08_01530 [Cytophagales bacterium]|nr:hypothetical protein [Cytophagales bacterium]
MTDLTTGTVVYASPYLYGTAPIAHALPPGLRTNTPYGISVGSYDNTYTARWAWAQVATDNVATPTPYPVMTAPAHGRPVPPTVTVQLAGNPYNFFTVVEVIDLTTNTFLHQSPFLGWSNVTTPLSYTIPLSFDPAKVYRIQARNYSSIGGLYQTEITVNSQLPTARIYTPVPNATLTDVNYLFQADPVNEGTPPVQYRWEIEPTGAATPAQASLVRYGKNMNLSDYLIPGRGYRTRVTGLMTGETAAPPSAWTDFGLSNTATEPDTSTFQGKADYVFRYLDKTQVPTQILYDRVFPLGRLDMFNQQGRQDTSHYYHFLQVHSELYNANYNAENTMLPPDIVEALAFQKSSDDQVAIGIINYSFNVVDTNAVTDNLITAANGFYYDVAGRPRSPYVLQKALVVSPLTRNVRAGAVRFSLPSETVMSNTTQNVTNVQITGGDINQTITLTPGGAAATLSYTQTGRKFLRFVVTFSGGATQTTYASLNIVN